MKVFSVLLAFSLALAVLVGCETRKSSASSTADRDATAANTPSAADQTPNGTATTTNTTGKPADNTGVNERDRSNTLTPLDQGESEADRTLTQKVRQAVMADKSLSTTAHNVKIITRNGMVTLRGPVSTDAEKSTIHGLASQIAGAEHIDDQLEVAK